VGLTVIVGLLAGALMAAMKHLGEHLPSDTYTMVLHAQRNRTTLHLFGFTAAASGSPLVRLQVRSPFGGAWVLYAAYMWCMGFAGATLSPREMMMMMAAGTGGARVEHGQEPMER
jgi:hypothetical protein